MADGNLPIPPLPPHEEGENPKNLNHQPPVSSSIATTSQPQINPFNQQPNNSRTVLKHSHVTPNLSFSAIVSRNIQQTEGEASIRRESVDGLSSSDFVTSNVDLQSLNPISTFQGKPAVLFTTSDKKYFVEKLQFVLVGKFSHGRPSSRSINLFFINLKPKGTISFSVFDKKHIFIECLCKEDFYRIWLGLSWFIDGLAMRVFKWSSDFSPLRESAIAPVWIRVQGLPLYMFGEKALMSLANAIGKPIKVDPMNLSRTILNMAWICVELEVHQPLIQDVWVSFGEEGKAGLLDGFWVKIHYDVVPTFCSYCQHIGHTNTDCKRSIEIGNTGTACNVTTVSKVCVADGTAQPMELPVAANTILLGLDAYNQNLKFRTATLNASGAISLGVEKEGTALVGNGEGKLGGKKKGLKQLEGMLANKLILSESNSISPERSVNPKVEKQIQRKNKVYQAKKQQMLASESLEITNSFAILETDVPIEDLSLEGELDVAVVCAAAPFGYHGKDAAVSVPAAVTAGNARNTVAVSFRGTETGAMTAGVSSAGGSTAEAHGVLVHAGNLTAEHLNIHATNTHTHEEVLVEDLSLEDGEIDGNNEASKDKVSWFSAATASVSENTDEGKHPGKTAAQVTLDDGKDLGNLAEDDGAFKAAAEPDTEAAVNPAGQLDGSFNADGELSMVPAHTLAAAVAQTEELSMVPAHTLAAAVAQTEELIETEETAGMENATGGIAAHQEEITAETVAGELAAQEAAVVEGTQGNRHTASITPQKLSSAAAEFTPKWAVLVEELVEGKKQSHQQGKESLQEKSTNAGGQVVMVTNYAMNQLNERMRRLRGEPTAPILTPILDTSTRELDARAGSQMLNGEAFLSDGMGDIPRPFKIKSTPNSPKGKNSLYDSSSYFLSRKYS